MNLSSKAKSVLSPTSIYNLKGLIIYTRHKFQAHFIGSHSMSWCGILRSLIFSDGVQLMDKPGGSIGHMPPQAR